MHIEIFGLDKYVVSTLSHDLHKPIIQLTKIDENNLFFSVHETLLFHAGVDQNAWHTYIKISMPESLFPFQEALRTLITAALKDQTIHIHFEFILQKANTIFTYIQKNYPLFVSESNQVKIDPIVEDEAVGEKSEIYHGNIFAGKESELDKLEQSLPAKNKKKKVA